jgi:hypothetical protein
MLSADRPDSQRDSSQNSQEKPVFCQIRFVDYGANFSVKGMGAAPSGKAGSELGNMEVALDVGGICGRLGSAGPWVLDHHFVPEPCPSAAAAVLTHFRELRDHYRDGAAGIVTHKEPDFDALLSAWLFAQITNSEGKLAREDFSSIDLKKTDWLDSRLSWGKNVGDPAQAALLLAKYAARVDSARLGAVRCPRDQALHSVFLAARYRRGYEKDGLSWFFEETWKAMVKEGRNPFLDPLFDRGGPLDLELRLLEFQGSAYDADIRRARKSIVTVPVVDNYDEFFAGAKQVPVADALAWDMAALNPNKYATADAAWIRDPSCFLFKEWARLDTVNSTFGRGFDFLAVAYSGGRPGTNTSDYFFSLDPERSNGKHLYSVWLALQNCQMEAFEEGHLELKEDAAVRPGFEARAAGHQAAFVDPWWDGSNTKGTLVATPNNGSFGSSGALGDLTDDPVAKVVRKELEFAEFGDAEVHDFAFKEGVVDVAEAAPDDKGKTVSVDSDDDLSPEQNVFRFVRIPLLSGNNSGDGDGDTLKGRELQLAELAGKFLGSRSTPEFLLSKINGEALISWTRHGIVVFERAGATRVQGSADLRGAVNRMAAIMIQLQALSDSLHGEKKDSKKIATAQPYRQKLLRDILALKLDAAKPGGEVIQKFLAATGFESVMHTLDTLNEDLDSIVRERDEKLQKGRDRTLQLILTVGTAIGLWISWNQMEGLSVSEFGGAVAGYWIRFLFGLVLAGAFAAIFWHVASKSSD